MMARTELLLPGKSRSLALLRDQVEENFRFAPAASAAGLFNAAIATWALWSPAYRTSVAIWMAAIVVGAVWRLIVVRRSARADKTIGHYQRQKRWIEAIALYNGTIWGIGAALLSFVATPTQFALLLILCGGMMGASVTTYTSLARAGTFFVTPLAFGGLIALSVHPHSPQLQGTLFLACYLILLIRGGYARQEMFTARVEGKERLRATNETVKLLLNDYQVQSSDWLWQVDDNGFILTASDRFGDASGRNPAVLDDMRFIDLFDESTEKNMLQGYIERRQGFRNLTIKLTRDGAPHWWTISAQPMEDWGLRGMASDVTAQKRAEERVSYMAHYDGLTGLANRFLFADTLKRAIARKGGANGVAVLYLDLDSFKSVNDTLGHPIGDKLLCETARRVEDIVDTDMVVARLGGDEFAVLVSGENAQSRAYNVADQIIEAVSQPCILDASQVVTSTSIGIAHLTDETRDADILMKQADLALYAAKADGRNRHASYEPGMDKAAQDRRELEMDLRAALSDNQFELYFQPLVNIDSGRTVGYEALLRWNHPTRGIVMPDDFIPIAEETGLIVHLGEWVIRAATQEVANWPEHLRVSVNLSPAQMRSASLLGTVFNAIAAAGISPDRLEMEITENVLLHDSEVNIATLHKLHDFGVRVALDDFGTGYSSLNYLRSFPFDKIKIDRCFVADLDDNPECQAIIRAVTDLASSLGMDTTAEGVELSGQLDHLRAHGCTEAQGYFFSQPEKSESFTDLRGHIDPLQPDIPTAKVVTLLTNTPAKAADRKPSTSKRANR